MAAVVATPSSDALLIAAAARSGALSEAGYVVAIVSVVAGALGLLVGPWMYALARPRDTKPWWSMVLNACCCCGGDPLALSRALITGACAAWFLFVLMGTVLQTFAENTCASSGAILLAADLGSADACVALVRLLVWEDQRALAFGAYLSAAVMSALVLDARVTNVLVATGVSAGALVLLGGDAALPVPHERAGTAVALGLVAAMVWGRAVTARTQRVVQSARALAHTRRARRRKRVGADDAGSAAAVAVPDTEDPAMAIFNHENMYDGLTGVVIHGDDNLEAAVTALDAYGDAPAHVAAFVVLGAVAANMAAWALYHNDNDRARGWPRLMQGAAADTWTSVVPGACTGLLWYLVGPWAAAWVSARLHDTERHRRALQRALRGGGGGGGGGDKPVQVVDDL